MSITGIDRQFDAELYQKFQVLSEFQTKVKYLHKNKHKDLDAIKALDLNISYSQTYMFPQAETLMYIGFERKLKAF